MWIFKSNLSAERFLSSDSDYNKKYLSQLKKEYGELKNMPADELDDELFDKFRISGERLGYESKYFGRRTMLRDFALMLWLYEDKEAAKRLEEILTAVCSERTWTLPAHITDDENTIDLFAAETAQAISEILSLAGDKISPDVCGRCISEVNRRVIEPFERRKKKYGWESSKSNWSAVCGGCVGMSAIYLIQSEDRLTTLTDSLVPVFDSYMHSFAKDGACLEGLEYWNYGMTYFTAFVDLYKQRIGKDFPIDTQKAKKAAAFAAKCCMGGGFTVSFSDCGERCGIYSGLANKLNEMYGVPMPEKENISLFYGDECGRWCRAARDTAWAAGKKGITYNKENTVFSDAQWAMLHSGNMTAAVKYGNNGEPHNHNDVGTIIIMKNDKILLNDLGAGEYTREYFSNGRYYIFCNRSGGHSVPIIDGGEQKSGSEYGASDFKFDGMSVCADISGAYKISYLQSCVRAVKCDEGEVSICDSFKFDRAADITERFITRKAARVKNGGVQIIEDGKCIGFLKSENPCNIEVKTVIHKEHDGTSSEIHIIDFIFTADKNTSFSIKIQ